MKKNIKLRLISLLVLAVMILGGSCQSVAQERKGTDGVAEAIEQVDTIKVKSEKMGKTIKNVVIVPAQYYDDELQDEQYPVVYLLHGYSGCYSDWIKQKPELEDAASEYSIIIVCPDGEASWYLDSPVNPKSQYETYVANELVTYIDNNYRTIPEANMRAITGLSMGGHGALWLGFRHPDIFGACGSMSGGVDYTPFPEKWEIKKALGEYSSNKALWEKSTVVSLVPTLKKTSGQKIIFDCGCDDFFFKVNNNLHDALLKAGIPHDYIVRPGKHNWKYWCNSIDYQLLFFTKFFGGE